MSEQELVSALQELVARHARPAEPRRLTSELMARDWRMGLLAGITALLWIGGIAGVLYMIVCFNRFIVAYSGADEAMEYYKSPKSVGHENSVDRGTMKMWEFEAKMKLHHSLEACLAAVPALLLAALGTIWLVFWSRRATLKQINLSLAEISSQLREMRRGKEDAGR
jgi:hypothetical protein